MISIRKYMDAPAEVVPVGKSGSGSVRSRTSGGDIFALVLSAYRAALTDMGRSSVEACAATGPELERNLRKKSDTIAARPDPEELSAMSAAVREHLQDWGRNTARHLHQMADEVKALLLTMAKTAESVGERDGRCADRMNAVTAQLQQIANLDDIFAMRRSIEQSAAELKNSVESMVAEGRSVLDELQTRVATFQARVEEAEETAARDALTHLRSRLYVEHQLGQRAAVGAPFCIAILDIDGFKQVNDAHGHVVGDELLRQFSAELRSACRPTDVVGRWGGDEFIALLDCDIDKARTQMDRVQKWACGKYVIPGKPEPLKLMVAASLGVAEYVPTESLDELLHRADAEMYRNKTGSRIGSNS